MEFVSEKKEVTDILAKVLSSIPADFVFDEVYVIDQLSSEYPDEYLKFCTLYADREKPMEMAAEAICAAIETFEGVMVGKLNRKDSLPTLYTRHKVWKKFDRDRRRQR
jgi:hypothetical protein